MSKKVSILHEFFFAHCPMCASQDFKLILNGPGNQWNKILGTMCSDCEYIIRWVEENMEIVKEIDYEEDQ